MEAPVKPTPIDKEVIWDKTRTIMSKTDKYGTIEYANEVFVDPQEVVAKIEPLYKKLLQIEEATGMEGSEKYLTGFLEEQGKDYVEFLKDLMSEYHKEQAAKAAAQAENNKPVESKGFFARFFS
jgi:hypothetical protein